MQHTRFFLFVFVLVSIASRLGAVNPPPVNDTVCNATDLGILPVPGACPGAPYGDTIVINGTTEWAQYNTFDFSPAHCFPGGSPDVWYKFRGTGSFIYFEMTGFNDLDSFFVKLHYSQGSCLSLVPLHCEITTNGTMQAAFLTPHVGGEYYLQIGGAEYDEWGPFTFSMKAYNECTGCVKNASIELSPAPWFGRYGTNDTVQMCVTVERWDQTTSSLLHAIVPVFGDEWDTTTLTPVSFPGNAGSGWMWGQNLPSPAGNFDGFFFDGNQDGDPTNNPGEPGNISTTWTGCWSISTKPYCNAYDASVQINIYADNETGNGNTAAVCQSYWPINLGLSGWCCPDPIVSITQAGSCTNPAVVIVDPVSTSASDTFNVVLYDDEFNVVGYSPNVTTTAGFSNVLPGDYLIEAYNVSTTCISFHQLHIEEVFQIDMTQTVVGCGPNSSSVVADVTGPGAPFTYAWPNITTFTDSLAFNLNEGYQSVIVTDAAGCSLTDSIYVLQQNMPGAMFGYADKSYCHNDDTIKVYYQPFTAGGIYQLSAPLSSGITVDPVTGTISLNSTTQTPPYYIYVKYTVGNTNCTDAFVDSVQIVQQPSAPVASSSPSVDWCIGSTAPTHSIFIGTGIPLWYDVQSTQTGFGYTFTPSALNASTAPGQYLYGVVALADFTGGCSSWPTIFTVNAIPSPNFFVSPGVTICTGDTAYISATGSAAYTYSWTPAPVGGPQNTAQTFTSPAVTTTYSVTVADGICQSSQTLTVVVDPTCPQDENITVYSGITPNNDGYNDVWIVDGADSLQNLTVHIYNRWGYQVWKRTDYNNNTVVFRGDDDTGNPLPSGTYYYVILHNSFEPIRGWIELTR